MNDMPTIPIEQTHATQPVREDILQFFAFAHLKPELQEVSEPFAMLAEFVCNALPRNAERTVSLRKLLEAKDAAVRAHLHKQHSGTVTGRFTSAQANFSQEPRHG